MLDFKVGRSDFDKKLAAFDKRLKDVKLKSSDLREVAPLIQETLSKDVLHRFETAPKCEVGGKVYGGRRWRRLKDSTLKQRPDRIGRQIMTDTGRLKKSFKLKSPENIATVSRRQVYFGSSVPYARKQSSMRSLIFWHPELFQKVVKIFIKHLLEDKTD